MIKIFIGLIAAEIGLAYMFQFHVFDEFVYGTAFVGLNYIALLFLLAVERLPRWTYIALFSVYSIKIPLMMVMYADIQTYINMFKIWDVFVFYHSGALEYMSNNDAMVQLYSKLVAHVYESFGTIMEIPVFFNVVVSLFADVYFYKILSILKLECRTKKIFLLIFMLLPWRNLQAMFLLREAIPTFLVVMAIYFFIKYMLMKKNLYMIISVCMSVTSLAFHAGLLPITFIILIFFIFFDKNKEKLRIRFWPFLKVMPFLVIVTIALMLWGEVLLFKITLIIGKEDAAIAAWSHSIMENAGSVYLQNLPYTSFNDILLQSPLRMVYFLFSPMPWDIRGVKDMGAFIFDSSVHICGIWYVMKRYSQLYGVNRYLAKILMAMYLITALFFGAGTFDSGTAMRHRAKFTSIITICLAISYDERNRMTKLTKLQPCCNAI